jgi:hypothetical protein
VETPGKGLKPFLKKEGQYWILEFPSQKDYLTYQRSATEMALQLRDSFTAEVI